MDRSDPARYPEPVIQQAPSDTKAALEAAFAHALEFIDDLERCHVRRAVAAVQQILAALAEPA